MYETPFRFCMYKESHPDKNHFLIHCSSSFEYLDAIVNSTETFLAGHIKDEELSYKVLLLLSEAATNAIEHGNAQDASKHVVIEVSITPSAVLFSVEDEGKGFAPSELKNPVAEPNLLNEGGRGIFFMEQMADEVAFENEGSKVIVTLYREKS